MNEQDTGNKTTQTIYELATQPTFVDRSEDAVQNVSWEVSDGEPVPLTPENEQVPEKIEDTFPVQEKEENQIVEEIGELEDESDSEEDTEKEKKKKRNRVSEKNRIYQLTRELRQAQSVAHDVLKRNQYLESKMSEKDKEALTAQENYLTSQKERVKKYLTEALEEGDPAKIAEANDLLSQYNTEILLMGKQKKGETNEIVHSYDSTKYDVTNVNPYQEVGNEWIEKNSWANPQSPNFDQEMYQEADEYSIRLAKKYKLQGRGDEIGNSDFLDEVTDHIKNSYDISAPVSHSKPQPRERMQMKTDKTPTVGSVDRPQARSEFQGSGKITLTPAQIETAINMRGYVRDPKTGNPITDNNTLIEIYKRNMMKG
jgi:hypothetical protein